ncbi:hypothetical protein JHK87_009617 [Glycine soja]|nr:hypothetical protein JHK87_009617 [Glycine soja]
MSAQDFSPTTNNMGATSLRKKPSDDSNDDDSSSTTRTSFRDRVMVSPTPETQVIPIVAVDKHMTMQPFPNNENDTQPNPNVLNLVKSPIPDFRRPRQLVPTEPFPHAHPPRAEIRELGDGAKIALDIELLQHGRYAMQMDDGHSGIMSDMEISQPIGKWCHIKDIVRKLSSPIIMLYETHNLFSNSKIVGIKWPIVPCSFKKQLGILGVFGCLSGLLTLLFSCWTPLHKLLPSPFNEDTFSGIALLSMPPPTPW